MRLSSILALLSCGWALSAQAMTPPGPPDGLPYCMPSDADCTAAQLIKLRAELETEFADLPDLRDIIKPYGPTRFYYSPSPLHAYAFDKALFDDLSGERWVTDIGLKSLSWHDQLGLVPGKVTLQPHEVRDLFLVTTTRQGQVSEEFFTLGGLLRITDYQDGYRNRLAVEVKADTKPLPQSRSFALRTRRPEISQAGERFEEESLKVCRYSQTFPVQARFGSGSGDIRLYACKEIRSRSYVDGRLESFSRSSQIGYAIDYKLFLPIQADHSGCCALQTLTAIGDTPPDDSHYPDWLKGKPTP